MNETLMRAIFDGDLAGFDAAVQQGADLSAVTKTEHWNLLHRALVSVNLPLSPAIIGRLITLGVDMDARDREGYTPLHFAARARRIEIVRMLLDARAEIDPVNKEGSTPLRLALTTKPADAALVELLLQRGADMDQKPPGGLSARQYAEAVCRGAQHVIVDLFDHYSR